MAGTGGIEADGLAIPMMGIDVKVVTAMLTRPDVIFVTEPPTLVENVTGYEQAGRVAAGNPGTVPVVVVHDLRQALAWLCGRTDGASVCAVASRSASLPIGPA